MDEARVGLPEDGVFVGRVWRPGVGPSIVAVRGGAVVDITTRDWPTLSHLIEAEEAVEIAEGWPGQEIGTVEELEAASLAAVGASYPDSLRLLAPCDLQAVKACGVTFARSMIERVIEERAGGDPSRAEAIRTRVGAVVGERLRHLVPGSEAAAEIKRVLIAEGLWSQYLEVGIGPDAEVFTKCPPMAAVGWGAEVGLHPISRWNNPEPEVVLACDSRGRIRGAALGNDVNLRDVEGRSALLLGKAKDNNASASVGPFVRLLDEAFTLNDLRGLELSLVVEHEAEGFRMEGRSSMSEISRDPEDLARQACGRHHQYPDGFMLYCGTLFAPVEDRDAPGQGFTHHLGDRVTIVAPELGALVNTVSHSTEAPPWTFGTRGADAEPRGARASLEARFRGGTIDPRLVRGPVGEKAMTNSEVLLSQLTDPFRLGLIVALVVTMLRTEAVTGRWIPLAAGVAFVAAVLPLTTSRGLAEGAMWQAIALGIVANLVLLALVMAIRHLVLRIMP